jgi:hypothetical protein
MKQTFFVVVVTFLCMSFILKGAFEVPISVGDLIDKVTILFIKTERISDREKLQNITKELNLLLKVAEQFLDSAELVKLMDELYEINNRLWDIECKKRLYESHNIGELSITMSHICEQFPTADDVFCETPITPEKLSQLKEAMPTIHDFVMLSRDVHLLNDERAAIKRAINLLCNSELIEEKKHTLD